MVIRRRPHQSLTCSGLVVASKTRRRGASRTLVITSSVSDGVARVTTGLLFTAICFLLVLQLTQVIAQLTHTLFPDLAIALHPIGYVLQRSRLQPAGPPLRLPALGDQAGPAQDLEVLGDGRQLEPERLGPLHHRGFAPGHTGQDRPPGWVGHGPRGGA